MDHTDAENISIRRTPVVPSGGDARGTKVRKGKETPRGATLAIIAAEAGVSLPTVSKVVNGRPDVAPATRLRVERLLDDRHGQI